MCYKNEVRCVPEFPQSQYYFFSSLLSLDGNYSCNQENSSSPNFLDLNRDLNLLLAHSAYFSGYLDDDPNKNRSNPEVRDLVKRELYYSIGFGSNPTGSGNQSNGFLRPTESQKEGKQWPIAYKQSVIPTIEIHVIIFCLICRLKESVLDHHLHLQETHHNHQHSIQLIVVFSDTVDDDAYLE